MRLVSVRLIRTSWFRMAIGYAVLSIASVTMLFALLYWNTAVFVAEQTEETIEAEITGLAEHYRQAGLFGLTEVIQERSQGQRLSLYLLTDPNRRPIAGNLNSWPAATQPGEWMDFDYQRQIGSRMVEHRAHARHALIEWTCRGQGRAASSSLRDDRAVPWTPSATLASRLFRMGRGGSRGDHSWGSQEIQLHEADAEGGRRARP